jgi:hypothetical protein
VASTNLKPNAIEQVPASIKVAATKATTKPSTTRKKLQMESNFDSLENLELGKDDTRSHSTPDKEDGCDESTNNEGGGEVRLDSRPTKKHKHNDDLEVDDENGDDSHDPPPKRKKRGSIAKVSTIKGSSRTKKTKNKKLPVCARISNAKTIRQATKLHLAWKSK